MGRKSWGTQAFKTIKVSGIFTVSDQVANYSGYYTNTLGTISNPDAQFNVIRSNWGGCTFAYGGRDISGVGIDKDSWVSVNAFITSGYHKWNDTGDTLTHNNVVIAFGGNDTESRTWNIVITNDGTNTTSAVNYGEVIQNSSTLNKIHFVMCSRKSNGDGSFTYLSNSQTLAGDQMSFTGGVTMQSGALYLNYSATDANVSHGTLKFEKIAGAEIAEIGNVTQVKGTTGATPYLHNEVGGTFAFTNLEVSNGGGTIAVRLDVTDDNALLSDKLSFSGTATGTGNVVIELLDANGGTNVDSLVEYLIENNSSEKVVSWVGKADSSIIFGTTDDYKSYMYNDVEYIFTALNKDDGLYISYIAVPEPATIAAIFGAPALGLTIYRRRK